VVLAMFGVLHLSWLTDSLSASHGTMLGLVIGFLALLRFPLGTALGFTPWVLLRKSRAQSMTVCGGDGQRNSAVASS